MVNDTITFISNRQPVLKDGEYWLDLTLDISQNGKSERTFTKQYAFTVLGERYALKAEEVQSVFPPAGSLGDHSNVLPQIILNRCCLPWERKADPEREEIPWLALLLFDEQETPKPEVVALKDLWSDPCLQKIYSQEAGQNGEDKVTLISVELGLLESLLPEPAELVCLAHVRQRGGEEYAVVIGNRLPGLNGTSTVHLVSLEGRYKDGKLDASTINSAGQARLVSLYSWHFSCQAGQPNFMKLLAQLNAQTLRLPKNDLVEAERYLGLGSALLPHRLRRGEATYSWYHGPLVPGDNATPDTATPSLPVYCADQLVRYNPETGLLDVSYAAAWTLGRLLALQNRKFSTDLFIWKQINAQALRDAERFLTHLPFDPPEPALELPAYVQSWFASLELLQGIPFKYLAPDPDMLPPETISFFYIDWLWLECLRDGAFSIGRVTGSDFQRDVVLAQNHMARPAGSMTGFLLRSEVVDDRPVFLVDGFGQDDQPLPLLRMERLAKNVLLCLFDGQASAIEIHLRPESMHFELTGPGSNKRLTSQDQLEWRLDSTGQASTRVLALTYHKLTRPVPTNQPFRRYSSSGPGQLRLPFRAWPFSRPPITPAQFAFKMMQGSGRVWFKQILKGRG